MLDQHHHFLNIAYQEAEIAFEKNEVPVGAVITQNNRVIAKAYNLKESKKDVTAHAELLAIKKAQEHLGDWRLTGCNLYSTLEPCPMCAGAIIQARVDMVVFGAKDIKWGAGGTVLNLFEDHLFNHNVSLIYLKAEKCGELLRTFFKNKRTQK